MPADDARDSLSLAASPDNRAQTGGARAGEAVLMATHRVALVAGGWIGPAPVAANRDDPTAVGTAEYADAIIEKLKG